MNNASELPGENEQAKPATPKRRTTRSKPESATAGSQEQEKKPRTQRQRASTASTASAAPAAPAAPATPAVSTADVAISQSQSQIPGQNGSSSGNVNTQTTPVPMPPPAPAQPAGGTAPVAPRSSGPASAPRATGTAPVAPRSSGPASAPRPGRATVPAQRPASTTFPQRPTSTGGTSVARTPAPGGVSRPISRPGSPSPTATRPGGQHGVSRPATAGRPTAPVQRPQERRAIAVKEKPTGPVSIPPQIVVKDLADSLHTSPIEVIRNLIKHGVFASINQVVDYEKAALVAKDLGFEPSQSAFTVAPAVQRDRVLSASEALVAAHLEENMVVIPPVVTIMGHVDHGKTSLLDTIRKTKVAAGEAGGITQHIGAYQVEVNGKKITFVDTPGHEAFTAMRARGAQVTHIAIIVVAADDGVMPQTREAIDHARAANVPIIIALNKIDKANANPDRVKQQLADIGVVIEEYGGDVVCVPVSARKGTGIDDLLEMILLVAEVQDIKANPNRPATGVIIEAKLEKNTGPMATVLIQQGTLKMGDNIVVGALSGKVRAMFNDRGKRIQKAPPSTPVSILGLPEVPQAGDRLEVVPDERTAKQMAAKVAEQRRNETGPLGQVSLDTLYMQEGKVKELNIVLKCDVQGSAEAIKNALTKVGEENIKVRLIHEGIGNISETDVHLAAASGAVIIGFNVKADGAALRQAQKERVQIRYYDVIYKLMDDIQAALTGMLEPTYREVIEGHAEVMQTFKAGKNTIIAGCRVTDGKITRSSSARVLRKNTKVFDGKIASLRRGKDDVREVASGYECGIVLEDFSEIEVGDIIESFTQERV